MSSPPLISQNKTYREWGSPEPEFEQEPLAPADEKAKVVWQCIICGKKTTKFRNLQEHHWCIADQDTEERESASNPFLQYPTVRKSLNGKQILRRFNAPTAQRPGDPISHRSFVLESPLPMPKEPEIPGIVNSRSPENSRTINPLPTQQQFDSTYLTRKRSEPY